MESQKFAVGESLSFGWNGMKKHFWFFFVLLVANTVIGIVMQAIPVPGDTRGVTGWLLVLGIAGMIAAFVVVVSIKFALLKSQLAVADGHEPSYDYLKPQPLLWFKLGLAYLLTQIILIIGFVLLIIPGIYFAVRLQFVLYAVLEHGYWPFRAIGNSWKITRGHWWDLLLFNVASFGVNLLGFLALLIGMFASVPTTRIASAHVYRQLSR